MMDHVLSENVNIGNGDGTDGAGWIAVLTRPLLADRLTGDATAEFTFFFLNGFLLNR
jgi:hypothetical protein